MFRIELSNKQCALIGKLLYVHLTRKKQVIVIGPKNPPMDSTDKKISLLEKQIARLRAKKNGKRPYTLNRKPSTCLLCNKTCLNQGGLAAHMRIRHKKTSSA